MDSSSSNPPLDPRDQIKIQPIEEREEGYDSDQGIDNEVVENVENVVQEVVVVMDHHNNSDQNFEEKHCWVCFASEEDDPSASWTHPCK